MASYDIMRYRQKNFLSDNSSCCIWTRCIVASRLALMMTPLYLRWHTVWVEKQNAMSRRGQNVTTQKREISEYDCEAEIVTFVIQRCVKVAVNSKIYEYSLVYPTAKGPVTLSCLFDLGFIRKDFMKVIFKFRTKHGDPIVLYFFYLCFVYSSSDSLTVIYHSGPLKEKIMGYRWFCDMSETKRDFVWNAKLTETRIFRELN